MVVVVIVTVSSFRRSIKLSLQKIMLEIKQFENLIKLNPK